jgi:isohexenylglutaconyl-CoA hydratase
MTIVTTTRRGPHLTAVMDDPTTRNAMSDGLLDELNALFASIEADDSVRTLVLTGADGMFCAGADLKNAGKGGGEGRDDPAWRSNQRGGQFFARLNALPCAVIAIVDGPAFGGGFGMACCADIVLVTRRARFALSETGLGLVPAQIAPHVVGRIGLRHARRLALTGQRFDGPHAVTLGLADAFAETAEDLQPVLDAYLTDIGRCAPRANRATKALLQSVGQIPPKAFIDKAADAFATAMRDEGAEGVAAFAQKRPAAWVVKP